MRRGLSPMNQDPLAKVVLSERFTLSVQERTLYCEGEPVKVGARALEILLVLSEKPGHLVSKQELLARVWPNQHVDETALRVHLSALRRLLVSDGEDRKLIVNESGRGYRLVPPAFHPADGLVARQRLKSTLPLAVASLIGRQAMVTRCTDILAARRLLTLTGPGGIGKTTLAVAAASAFATVHDMPVLFLDLADMADAGALRAELARQLGLFDLERGSLRDLAEVISASSLLIVLDTCEHLIDTAATFAENLLGMLPNLVILATSREPLRAAGEWVLHVPPLGLPQGDAEGGPRSLLHPPAVRLFIERAQAVCPDFAPSSAELLQVNHICLQLDGMPLAIEMAAARLATHTLSELARLLSQGLSVLVSGRRTAPARHRTLVTNLDWSFNLLGDEERDVFDRLCVFNGAFSMKDAIDVVGTIGMGTDRIVCTITALVEKSLVMAQQVGTETRYSLLKTLRHYGLRHAMGNAAWREASRNHARRVLSLTQGGAKRLADDRADTLPALIEDVRSALAWAAGRQGDPELATALFGSASRLFFDLSLPITCLDLRATKTSLSATNSARMLVQQGRCGDARRVITQAGATVLRMKDAVPVCEPRMILADLG
jgi:predicted ATPase/DNA-binding winged helix-turn-helix (wHTH) protein